MNGFEQTFIREIMNRQEENFRHIEERKHNDANIQAEADMTNVPDVRERKENR